MGGCAKGLDCDKINDLCVAKVAEEVTACPTGWIPLANTCGETTDTLCVTIGAPLKVCKLMNLYQTLLCLMR